MSHDEVDELEGTLGATAGTEGGPPRKRVPARVLERGESVGRYVVVSRLGAGAMGVVYAAYDPELGRKVALKLLLPSWGDPAAARARLQREAQALAKLSHPNVVAVHDVGLVGEQVYLAMEFVEGHTVTQWLAQGERSWREALNVFEAAARGLAAAHAQGLLHRDVKPDNLMIDADGRVRVMDFGLARAVERVAADPEHAGTEESGAPAHGGGLQEITVGTLAGGFAGTPAYMAPEQFAKESLDARADQFGLCVALWEALYAERPFAGDSVAEVAAAVVGGERRPPPPGRAVPRWLRRVVERGLAGDPNLRWPNLTAMLAAIERGRLRTRRVKIVSVVAGLGVAVVGGLQYRELEERRLIADCDAAGAEITEVWNEQEHARLRAGLLATGAAHASSTADKVVPWVDAQARAWREARTEACLDANLRQQWSAQTLERSQWCLDAHKLELGALVHRLQGADVDAVTRAVLAVTELPAVAPCRDTRLLQRLRVPSSEQRDAVQALRARLSEVSATQAAGAYDEGLTAAREVLAEAQMLPWPPLLAAARYRVGSLLAETGDYDEAEAMLESAYFVGAKSGAPEAAMRAARQLTLTVGHDLARHSDGRRWHEHAEVVRAQLPDVAGLDEAANLANLATVHLSAGAYSEAIRLGELVLAQRRDALGLQHPAVARSFESAGNAKRATGAYDEALQYHEQALAIREEALGPNHPEVAASLNNLAIVHLAAGRYDEALALHERALVIKEEALGREHPDLAATLNNLANVYDAKEAYAEAAALHERALAIKERAFGADHPSVASSLNSAANRKRKAGEHEEAAELFERALAIQEKALGPNHVDVASTLNNLGLLRQQTGADQEAAKLHARALAIKETALGPDHPDVAVSLNNLAQLRGSGGDYEEAAKLLERAVAIKERALGPEHPAVATSLNNLASAYAETGAHARAITLYTRALAIREKALGPEHSDLGGTLFGLAEVRRSTGALDEARASYERALSIWEKARGPDDGLLAYPLLGLSRVALARNQSDEAESHAERALRLREAGAASSSLLAEARFAFALAQWESGGGDTRPRAIALAEQAADGYRDAGEDHSEDLAEVEEWLRTRRGPATAR